MISRWHFCWWKCNSLEAASSPWVHPLPHWYLQNRLPRHKQRKRLTMRFVKCPAGIANIPPYAGKRTANRLKIALWIVRKAIIMWKMFASILLRFSSYSHNRSFKITSDHVKRCLSHWKNRCHRFTLSSQNVEALNATLTLGLRVTLALIHKLGISSGDHIKNNGIITLPAHNQNLYTIITSIITVKNHCHHH